ncbi:DNRLRE domain-containing protein [bacterium]|nr:DNRLRE domain-containing protein [bacterium]
MSAFHLGLVIKRRAILAFSFIFSLAIFFSPTSASAHMDLLSPDGTATLHGGQLVDIDWNVYISHGPGYIDVEFSSNDGGSWTLLEGGIPYTGAADQYGSILWQVPNIDTAQGRIRVTYYADGGGSYYNGQFSGQNDPQLTIASTTPTTSAFEEGVDSYSGTRDTTIYEAGDLSNGGGQHIFVGNNSSSSARRGFLAYDLSSIPPGSTILSASLTMTVSMDPSWETTTTQKLHVATTDWGEGTVDAPDPEGNGATAQNDDATWFEARKGGVDWITDGGDYIGTESASADVNNSAVGNTITWTSAQMVADIQDWIDGSTSNYGWILIGDEGSSQNAIRYYSSESGAADGSKPHLSVTYESSLANVENWQAY